jgi:hypothetical protein
MFNGVTFPAFGAVLFSSRTVRVASRGSEENLRLYKASFAGAHELLLRNHFPYDFILDGDVVFDRLKRYRFLVLPDALSLTASQCAAVTRYVESGGAVLATHETSLYDARGRRRKDFGLSRLFGAHYAGNLGLQSEGYSVSYARFVSEHPVACNGLAETLFPIGGKYLAVRSTDGIARLLNRCRYYCDYPQAETKHPAIVARTFGRGKLVYIPGEFFRFYHAKGLLECAQFFRQSIEWFVKGALPIVTDLPDTVEVTLTKNAGGKLIVHLLNCSFDKTRPITEIIPVRGKHLALKARRTVKRAVDLTTGRRIGLKQNRGVVTLRLPVLRGYTVLVVS